MGGELPDDERPDANPFSYSHLGVRARQRDADGGGHPDGHKAEDAKALARLADAVGLSVPACLDASPLVDRCDNDDDWDASPGETSIGALADLAAGLSAVFDRWRCRDRLLFGFAHHEMDSYFMASSTGLRRRFDQPGGRLDVTGKSGDLCRSAWSGVHARDFTDVDIAAVAKVLEQRLGWQARRVDLPAGRYETILPPSAVLT